MNIRYRNNFIFVLILLLVINFCGFALSETVKKLNDALTQYKVRFKNGDSFIVTKEAKYPAKEKTFHSLVAKSGQTLIKMEIIEPLLEEKAIPYTETKYKIIKSLFESNTSPYPGAVTNVINCPEEKKPEEKDIEVMGKPIKVLITNATERYVLGVWADDLIKNKAVYAVVYEPFHKVHYQIVIFQPIESFSWDEMLDILRGFRRLEEK